MLRRKNSKTQIPFEAADVQKTPSMPTIPHSPGKSSSAATPKTSPGELTIDEMLSRLFSNQFHATMKRAQSLK